MNWIRYCIQQFTTRNAPYRKGQIFRIAIEEELPHFSHIERALLTLILKREDRLLCRTIHRGSGAVLSTKQQQQQQQQLAQQQEQQQEQQELAD
jgi:hypothetical protein